MFFRYFIVIFGVVRCFEETKVIEIGKPSLTCDKNGQIKEVPSEVTYIKLPPDKHAYYSLNTEKTSENINNRYHPITWKTIRDIEYFLNWNFADTGADGTIYIKNNLFTPGFHYLLHVTLRNSPGDIEEQDYNLTFISKKVDKSEVIVGSLELVTSNYFYTYFPVIVNAKVMLCGKEVFYDLKWEILTSTQTIKLTNKDSKLSFYPQEVSKNNETKLTVTCQIVENENKSPISKKFVHILINNDHKPDKLLEVFLPFKYTTVDISETLYIKPHIFSNDKGKSYTTKWECTLEDTLIYSCQGQINDEFYMETGFTEPGNYTITLTVKQENLEKRVITYIMVKPNVPSIKLQVLYPVVPEQGIQINAHISGLRTYCTVQWLDYESNDVKLEDIPGVNTETKNISSKDKYFLEELVDFGNIKISKHFHLKIPATSRTWNGLTAGSIYVIRLKVLCPNLQEVNRQDIFDPEHLDVTSLGQVEIHVPELPKVGLLEVDPGDGEAFGTCFSFKVTKDLDESRGVLYQYGFEFEGVDVIFFEGIDVFSGYTSLPCSQESGIITFVRLCDFLNRCRKHYGPEVNTTKIVEFNENLIIRDFKQKLLQENFDQIFSYAMIVLNCAKETQQFDNLKAVFSEELEDVLTRKTLINDFLNKFHTFQEHLPLTDSFLQALSSINLNEYGDKRVARQAKNPPLDTIKNSLEELEKSMQISEFLIKNLNDTNTKNNETNHFLIMLEDWMEKGCTLIHTSLKEELSVEMHQGAFSIKNSRASGLIPMPFAAISDTWRPRGYLKLDEGNSNYSCLGLVAFKELSGHSDVFGVSLYDPVYGKIESNNASFSNISLFLPKKDSDAGQKCFMSLNGWITSCPVFHLEHNKYFVECRCSGLGYYFLSEAENNKTNVINTINIRARDIGQKISYVIIFSSLVGFLILFYIIRKLTIYPPPNNNMFANDHLHDNYMYAEAMDLLD